MLKRGTIRSYARGPALWIALALLAAVPAGAADIRYTVPAGDSPSIACGFNLSFEIRADGHKWRGALQRS